MIKNNDGDMNKDEPSNLEQNQNQEEQITEEKIKVKKNEQKGPTICLLNCHYDIVHQVAEMYNLKEVEEDDNWDIFWSDYFVSFKRFRELKRFQRINHFPGMMEICRKDRLAKNLNNMFRLFPEEYDFFPRTWCFPTDLVQVLSYNRREKNKTYILKPVAGNKGRGILITKSLKDIRLDDKVICQEYLTRPYLIDGYKFDLRLYTLITSCDPLRIYIFNEGLVRFATCKYYEPTDFNTTNVFMHLTNYSVNKYSRKYKHDDQSGSKRKLSWLNQYMVALGYDVDKIWHNIDDVIIKTVFSILPTLRNSYYICFPHHDVVPACFELLGMDVILDNNLAPKLLEVNHSPSFHTDTPLDIEVKKSLLTDMFAMLNLEHSDKTKGKQNHVPANTSSECVKNTKKPTKVSYFIEYCCHEIQHKGSFRLIYPSKHQYLYNKFLEHAKSKFNQDIPCTRCVTVQEQEEQIKDITQEINTVNPTTTKIIHSDDVQSSHGLATPTPLDQDAANRTKLVTYQPQHICETDEEERIMHLAQREVLVKSFGIVDLIYLSQKRNGVLRHDDEKKYKRMKLTGKMKRLRLRNRMFERQRNSPTIAKQYTESKSSIQYYDLEKRNSKNIKFNKPIQPTTVPKLNKKPSVELKYVNPRISPQMQNYLECKEIHVHPPNSKQSAPPPKCDTDSEIKTDTGKHVSKFLTKEDFHKIFTKVQTKPMVSVQSVKCDKVESKTHSFNCFMDKGRKNPYDDYMFSNKYNKPLIYNVMANEVQTHNAENERQETIIEKVLNSSILSHSNHLIDELKCKTPPPSSMALNYTIKNKEQVQNVQDTKKANLDISKAEMVQNSDTNKTSSFTQKYNTNVSSNMLSSLDGNKLNIKPEFANKTLSSTFDLKKKNPKDVNFLNVNNNDSFVASQTIMKNKTRTAQNVSDPKKTDSRSNNQSKETANNVKQCPPCSSNLLTRPEQISNSRNLSFDKKYCYQEILPLMGSTNSPPNISNNSTIENKEQIITLGKVGTTSNTAQHTNRDLKKEVSVSPYTKNIPDVTSITSKVQTDGKESELPKCVGTRSKTQPSSIFLKQKKTTSRANIPSFSDINKIIIKRDNEAKTNIDLRSKMADILQGNSHKILSNQQIKPEMKKTDSKLNRGLTEPLVDHRTSEMNRPSINIFQKLSTRVPSTLHKISNLNKTESNATKYPSGLIQSHKRPQSQPQENVSSKKPDTGSSKKSSSQSDVVKYKFTSTVKLNTSDVLPKNRYSKIVLKKPITISGFPLQNTSVLNKCDSKPIEQQQSKMDSTTSRPFPLMKKHSTRNILNMKNIPYLQKSVTKYIMQRKDQVVPRPQESHGKPPPTHIQKKSKNKHRPVIPFPYLDKNTESSSQKPIKITQRRPPGKTQVNSILRKGKQFPQNAMYTNSAIKPKKVRVEDKSKHWSVNVESNDKSCMCVGVSRLYMKSNIW